MRISKLSADFDYRDLHLQDVLAGDDSAIIDYSLFSGSEPIGDRWIPRKVVYFEESSQHSGDDCEGASSLGILASPPEGNKGLGDFPHCWGGIEFGVLTQRSFEALHELISPFVEFLPLINAGKRFMAFKVLRFVDALDHDGSVIEWFPQLQKDVGKPLRVRQIKRYCFIEDRVSEEVIFRIPEQPVGGKPVFVTERFVDAVKQHELTGFKFTQVWPHVDPRDQFMQKARERRQRRGKR